jgi:hypothetical protein
VLSTLGAAAYAQGFDVRFGAYFPSAGSNLFDDVSSLYTPGAAFGIATPPGVSDSDWEAFFGGVEYNHRIARNVELAVSFDWYGKTLDTSYRDYVRQDDSPIFQTLRLQIMPVGLSVRIVPTSRRARIAPFVVAGVDAMIYQYEEFGDFVDFFDPDQPIIPDSFISDGVAFGVHAGGGLRIALGDDFAIVGEARYYWSETDMDDDFAANRIDLGGLAVTAGFHLRF